MEKAFADVFDKMHPGFFEQEYISPFSELCVWVKRVNNSTFRKYKSTLFIIYVQ